MHERFDIKSFRPHTSLVDLLHLLYVSWTGMGRSRPDPETEDTIKRSTVIMCDFKLLVATFPPSIPDYESVIVVPGEKRS